MTDEEILQGIDKLEDGIPFDEIRNGDKWLDIHELFSEIRERIKWHYPSRGELPDKDVECLVHTKSGNNFIAMIDSSDNCWCTGEFFSEYLRDNYVLAWQYIVPPKEEV